MNDLVKVCICFCAENNLRIAHVVDLVFDLQDTLSVADKAASDIVKEVLICMRKEGDGKYPLSHKKIDKWIGAI